MLFRNKKKVETNYSNIKKADIYSLDFISSIFIPDTNKELPTIFLLSDWGQKSIKYQNLSIDLAKKGFAVLVLSPKNKIIFNQFNYAKELKNLIAYLPTLTFGEKKLQTNLNEIGLIGHGLGADAIQILLQNSGSNIKNVKAIVSLFPKGNIKKNDNFKKLANTPHLIIENQKNLQHLNSTATNLKINWGENAFLRVSKNIRSSELPEKSTFRKLFNLGQPTKKTQKIVSKIVQEFLNSIFYNNKNSTKNIKLPKFENTILIEEINNIKEKNLKQQIKELF